MEKSTEDLQSELTQAQSYDEFYNKNTSEIKFPSAVDYLNYLLDLKGITNKADFVKKTNLERTYVYHILTKIRGATNLLFWHLPLKPILLKRKIC